VTVVGILHPGAMGASLAAACTAPVLWCSAGRSTATRERAARSGAREVATIDDLVQQADVIVAVCPPEAAVTLADQVSAAGFVGTYVDANAIAPATARAIADRFDRFVDGGIVGPPARHAGTTRLYLSGGRAGAIAGLWAGSVVDARVVDGGPGAASALKMAYATWTKVSSALLLSVRALARAEGVEAPLLAEWTISQPGTEERSLATAGATAPKAWRFVGEMREIATTFADAGLPSGFGEAAAAVYAQLAARPDVADLEPLAVIDELSDPSG
jgi:3-hydroxyisobutyrate dehydrogenase-like beta-hydroxyacid dehydrogenase